MQPGNTLEQRFDIVESIVIEQRSGEVPSRNRNLNDGCVGWIELQYERRDNPKRLGNSRHRELDLLLNQRLSRVQIRAPLQPNVGDTEVVTRLALHVLDARGGTNVLLDAPGERLFDVLRCQTRG